MRDFKFICSLCQHRIQTRTVYANELIACPVCEGEIVIPEPPLTLDAPLPAAYPPGKEPPPSPTSGSRPSSFVSGPAPDAYDFATRPQRDQDQDQDEDQDPDQTATSSAPRTDEEPPDEERYQPPPSSVVEERADSAAKDDEASAPPPEETTREAAPIGPSEPAGAESSLPEETPPPEPDELPPVDVEEEPAVESSVEEEKRLEADLTTIPSSETGLDDAPKVKSDGFVPKTETPAEATQESPAEADEDEAMDRQGARSSEEPSIERADRPATPSAMAAGSAASSPFRAPSEPASRAPESPSEKDVVSRPRDPTRRQVLQPGPKQSGPHTMVLIAAVNAIVILIVAVMLLLPRDGGAGSGRHSANLRDRPPGLPTWSLEPTPSVELSPQQLAEMRQTVNSFVSALGRGDLLAAARLVTPATSVEAVTNGLARVMPPFRGSTTNDWKQLEPTASTNSEYLIEVRPTDSDASGTAELGFHEAPIGWRIVMINLNPPTDSTNVAPVRVTFGQHR